MPRFEYDREVDAAYIRLREGRVVRTADIGDGRLIDFGPDDKPVGIELLGVSGGVEPDGLPSREVGEESKSN
jgi:uncharacterized protein YuzE